MWAGRTEVKPLSFFDRICTSTDLLASVRAPETHHLLLQMTRARSIMREYRGLIRDRTESLLELVRAAQAGE